MEYDFEEPLNSLKRRHSVFRDMRLRHSEAQDQASQMRLALKLMRSEQRAMINGRRMKEEPIRKVNLIQKVLVMDLS